LLVNGANWTAAQAACRSFSLRFLESIPRITVDAMSADTDASAQLAVDWVPLHDGIDDVRVGDIAPPRRVAASGDRLGRLHSALRSVLGESDVPVGIADVCPDPLVFALESGLARATSLEVSIDGGSQWRDLRPIDGGELFAVSAVDEIAERPTADGRRLVRVVYETRFTDRHGVLVGTASGTSLHVGGPR
jgi:hypothetical protein